MDSLIHQWINKLPLYVIKLRAVLPSKSDRKETPSRTTANLTIDKFGMVKSSIKSLGLSRYKAWGWT